MEDKNTPYIYKECQRNHAAVLGKHSTDGCNQYVQDNTKPYGMFCEACQCHRNFHRQVSVLTDAPSHDHAIFPDATNEQQSGIPTALCDKDKEKAADVVNVSSDKDDDDDDDDEEYGTYPWTKKSMPRVSKVTPGSRIRWRRFTEVEKQKMRRLCKMLGWKMPGTGKGTEDVKSLCEEIEMSRDTFRKFMYKERPIVS